MAGNDKWRLRLPAMRAGSHQGVLMQDVPVAGVVTAGAGRIYFAMQSQAFNRVCPNRS